METDQIQNMLSSVTDTGTISSFSSEKMNLQKLFHKVSVLDYAIMWFLSDKVSVTEQNQKFYLKDLAQMTGMPMYIVTDMVKKLQEKNFVIWKHDGCGENGTYIQITDSGIQAISEQQSILKSFHANVLDQFGRERFLALLREMAALEDIMNREIEKENVKYEGENNV